METIFKKTPFKRLKGLQPAKAQAIRQAIREFATAPWAPTPNAKPLTGITNGVRLRVGDWRISMTVDRDRGIIEVFEIEPRGGAYR